MTFVRGGRRGRRTKGNPSWRALGTPGYTALADSLEPTSSTTGGPLARMGAVAEWDVALGAIPGSQWLLNTGSGGQQLRARFGSVGRAEVRSGMLLLPGTTSNAATIPHATSLVLATELDMCALIAADSYSPAGLQLFIAKSDEIANQAGFTFGISAGTFVLYLANSATTFLTAASASHGLAPGASTWVRVTWRASDGRVQFFTAPGTPGIPATWTQLGTDGTITLASINPSTTLVALGSNRAALSVNAFAGTISRAVIRRSIDGPAVLDVDFAAAPDLAASFTGGHGYGIKSGGLVLPAVTGTNASVPHSAVLAGAGDLDVTVDVTMPAWTAATLDAFVAKWANAGQNAWFFGIGSSGGPVFYVSTDGANAIGVTGAPSFGFPAGARRCVRVTRRQSDGRVQFFVQNTAGAWVQHGTDYTAAAGSAIFAGTDPVVIGANGQGTQNPRATVRRCTVARTLDGTPVLDVDFTAQPDDTQSFTCSTGQTVTVNGCARPTVTVAAVNAVDTNDPTLLVGAASTYANVNSGATAGANTLGTAVGFTLGNVVRIEADVEMDWSGSGQWNILDLDKGVFLYMQAGQIQTTIKVVGTVSKSVFHGLTGISRQRIAVEVDIVNGWADYYRWVGSAWVQLGIRQTFTPAAWANAASTYQLVVGSGNTNVNFYATKVVNDAVTIVDWDSSSITSQTSFPAKVGGTVAVGRGTAGKKSVVVSRSVLLFGTDDFLEVAHSSLIDFATADFTLVWVGRVWSNFGVNNQFISKREAPNYNGYGLSSYNGATSMTADVDGGTPETHVAQAFTHGALFVAGLRRNGVANTADVFVNNASTQVSTAAIGSLANNGSLNIGRLSAALPLYGEFEMFTAGVFAKVLSNTEIASLVTNIGAA